MNSLLYNWNLFKETWCHKIDKSNLYFEFENFMNIKLTDKEYCNKIKNILVSNRCVKKIELINNNLYIYQSPFNMIINDKPYPSGLFMEEIISTLIKYIEKTSSSPVKVTTCYYPYQEEEKKAEDF